MNRKKITIPPDYPDRVFAIRRRFQLTQEQFADRLGVSFASVNRWENGQNRPTRSVWSRLLRLAEGNELPSPRLGLSVIVCPNSEDRPIRINLAQVTSYHQPRLCDLTESLEYELHEYTVLFMNGGHKHIVHMCEIEFDKLYGVDPQWLTLWDAVADGKKET